MVESKIGPRVTSAADSPSEVAFGAEVVFTSLPGPSEVEATALDPERGILAGLRRGGTYIDLTTNAPVTVRLVAERVSVVAQSHGVEDTLHCVTLPGG